MKKHITARDAETLITLKLRELNAQILLAEDGTLKATTSQGQTLTIISLLPEEGSKAKFVLPEFQDRPHRFIVCTEQDETGAPVQWVFPEMCFTHRGVARKDRTAEVDLALPGQEPGGCTIRDGLYFLEERWDPIIQFDDFQECMPPPGHPEFADRWLDMEDILELIWWKEAPAPEKEDFIPIIPMKSPTKRGNSKCGSATKSLTSSIRSPRQRRRNSWTVSVQSRKIPTPLTRWGLRGPVATTGCSGPDGTDSGTEEPTSPMSKMLRQGSLRSQWSTIGLAKEL